MKISYSASSATATPTRTSGPVRRNVLTRVVEAVRAIALCHNVTPVFEESTNGDIKNDDTEADQQLKQKVTYQASSPDEVSLEKILRVYLKTGKCSLLNFLFCT